MMKKLRALLCLSAVGLLVYSGIMLGLPQYRYYAFRSDARDMVHFNVRSNEEMKGHFLKRAREYGVPVLESDIQVTKSYEGAFQVKASWSEDVNILDIYEKRFFFDFQVEE